MRHRRHTPLAPTRSRTLRATAAMPCVAVVLVGVLTGAAPGPDAYGAGPGEVAVVSAEDRGQGAASAKSPRVPGTSRKATHQRPSPAATDAPDSGGTRGDARGDARGEAHGRTHERGGPRGAPEHGPREDRSGEDATGRGYGDGTGQGPAEGSVEGSVEGPVDGAVDGADDGSGLFGTQNLYEPGQPEPAPPGQESAPSSGGPPTTAATGEVSPVLPLGAGLTLIGLGLALIALRLRHT